MKAVWQGALVAALMVPCIGIAQMAQAQAVSFGSGVGMYGLLNGDNISLYVDRWGDFGAPLNATTPKKPGGQLNGSGQPFINSDGSVNTLSGTNTYGILFSPTSTAGLSNIQAQVQAKTEYETLGNRNAVEGYSISVNGGATFTPYGGLGFSTPTLTVSGSSIDGALSATSQTTYTNGGTDLLVSQQAFFNTSSLKNMVEVTTTFTNLSATNSIQGLQYARGIDPNQGAAPPGNSSDVNTNQSFGTITDPTQFAINSTDLLGLNRTLALGVRGTDPNSAGSILFATSGAQTETALLTSPTLAQQGNPSYVELESNGIAAEYVDSSNPADDATTVNFQEYLQDPSLAPFLNAADESVTPAFSTFSDTDLVLLSPMLDLAPGASTTSTFYYTFGATVTPEPGMTSLALAGLCGAIAFRRSRKRR
jgi:hypothetical protein